jgi:hypothetical protein
MRVGYVNGLVPGTYASAFQWIDRMNNRHIGSFVISSGCAPGSLTWDEAPINVLGSNGAWLLRGRTPPSSQLRKLYVTEAGSGYGTGCAPAVNFFGGLGSLSTSDTQKYSSVAYIVMGNLGSGYVQDTTFVQITGGGGGGAAGTAMVDAVGHVVAIYLTNGGQGYTTPPTVTIYGAGTAATASAVLAGTTNTLLNTVRPAVGHAVLDGAGHVASLALNDGGAGYTSLPTVSMLAYPGYTPAAGEAAGIETHAEPFIRNPLSIAVQIACSAVPWWRGRKTLNSVKVYDDSLLIIRPSLIQNASLSNVGGIWQGTMNPVTDYVNAVLAFRRSCVMDLQIFGSGRLLFQGAFAVMSAIPTS